MDKKRIEIIATIALAVVFIFAGANAFKLMKRRAAAPVLSSSASFKPAPLQLQPEIISPGQEEGEKERLEWARCPFSGKLYSAGKGTRDLKLAGILWDAKTPIAMINDLFLKVGDRVEGNSVVSIKEDRVILNDGNKDFELRLEQ